MDTEINKLVYKFYNQIIQDQWYNFKSMDISNILYLPFAKYKCFKFIAKDFLVKIIQH